MLKAILVDLDGTLVESAHANAAAYAESLAEWGIVVDPAAMAGRIDGRSWRDFLPGFIGNRQDVNPEDVASRKRAIYPQFFHLLRLNHPLAELLQLMKGRLALALVTTASSQAVNGIKEQFALRDLFDVTVCGNDVMKQKPDPEAYIRAAGLLSVTPDECLLIEDSETGVAAARAFGGGLLRWSPA